MRSPGEVQVAFGAQDEESRAFGEGVQAAEIRIAAVHDVEGPGLDGQVVQRGYVRDATAGNMHKTRDIPAEVDQGVQFDGALVPAELRPGKDGKAQIDGCRIEGVDRLLQRHAKAVLTIETPGDADEFGRKVGVDSPIARLVGIGQRTARNSSANARMIQFGTERAQAGDDVAKTLALGQLREGHTKQLVPAGEGARTPVAVVTTNAVAKGMHG